MTYQENVTQKLELRGVEAKRYYLVKHELYKAYTETSKEKVSLYKIINILLLLFQKPIALVLYRKELVAGNDKYKAIFRTVADPILKDSFLNHLREYSNYSEDDFPYLKNKHINDKLHMIEGSKYGFILFEVYRNEEGNVDFQIISKNDNKKESLLMDSICKSVRHNSYAKKLCLGDHLESILDNVGKKSDSLDAREVPDIYFKKNYDFNYNNSNIYSKVELIVEEAYSSIFNTPIISIEKKFPPNVLFFYKFNSANKISRYGNHNYDIAIVIPKSQERHIRDMFKIIKNDKNSFPSPTKNKKWLYPLTNFSDESWDHKPSVIDYETNESYFYEHLDQKFIDILQSQDGIDLIIKSLKTPYTDKASSLADPVMSTGIMYIRRKPFSDGGDERLDCKLNDRNIDLKSPENIDVLRVISTHYLMSSMAPSSTNETLRLLLMPVRVDGATTFCMGTINVGDEYRGSHGFDVGNVGDSNWDFFFHFFTDVGQKCIRKIRREMEKKYTDEVKDIITRSLIKNIILKPDAIVLKMNNFKRDANKSFVELSRFFPYNVLYFLEKESDILRNNKNVVYLNGTKIYFNILENKIYEKIVNYNFVSEEKMKCHLEDAVKEAMLHISRSSEL